MLRLQSFKYQKGRQALITACSICLLTGCVSEGGIFDPAIYDPIDRKQELTRKDYQNMAAPADEREEPISQIETSIEKAPIPMPDIAQILAAPKPPRIGKTKLVSLTVTDDVPLKDVLIELARLAEVDVELGSGIRGGISFIAKDKPFSEVISRISDLAGLRYNIKSGVLRIERDLPYVKNYSLDFLNVIRQSTSDVSLSTDIFSVSGAAMGAGGGAGAAGGGAAGGGAAGGGGAGGGRAGGGAGGGVTTGTSTTITAESTSDFWEALESTVLQILNTRPAVDLEPVAGEAPALDPMNTVAANAPGGMGAQGGANAGQGQGGQGGGASAGQGWGGTFYVVNRQAGILSIAATERQHQQVQEYLALLKRNASAQVLIEAKIVEVALDEQFQSGVDWTAAIGNLDVGFDAPINIGSGLTASVLGPGGVNANGNGDNNLGINLDTVVQLLERFGTSRTLSSPRLHAIHNQQAVLTFAENRIFFNVNIEIEDAQVVDGSIVNQASTDVNATPIVVPIGIVLNILPSINLDDNEVTLNVRPTLTRQVSSAPDPASAFLNADLPPDQQFVNEVPVIEVRELDSVMKVKSGGIMVIGGLMEESNANTDTGLPYFSEVPWLGNAFKAVDKQTRKSELIMLIKATIVGPDGNYHKSDERIYKKFTDDHRPLVF